MSPLPQPRHPSHVPFLSTSLCAQRTSSKLLENLKYGFIALCHYDASLSHLAIPAERQVRESYYVFTHRVDLPHRVRLPWTFTEHVNYHEELNYLRFNTGCDFGP